MRNDSAVQGTNDSSILSKISTVQLNYFQDDFLKYFGSKVVRRSPLVNRFFVQYFSLAGCLLNFAQLTLITNLLNSNRGYYIRAKMIDYVLNGFIDNNRSTRSQIVNLGAGFDATFFRLRHMQLLSDTLFIEVCIHLTISYFHIVLLKTHSNEVYVSFHVRSTSQMSSVERST